VTQPLLVDVKVMSASVRRLLPLLCCAAVLQACASPASVPGATLVTPEGSPPRVIGYLASWRVGPEGVKIADLPADRLTHIFYAFGEVSASGRAALRNPCRDAGECLPDSSTAGRNPGGTFAEMIALKERHPHLRVLISLGGWTGSKYFSDAAATTEGRVALVASTLDLFFRRWPGLFDGVDVDWEFPVEGGLPENSYRPQDRQNYTYLLEEFRRQLNLLGRQNGRRYELTIAASAGLAKLEHLELDRLPAILDWINVMTYDYHAGGSLAHFNSPLRATTADPSPGRNIEATMRAFVQAGVPRSQLVVGVPFYGRALGEVAPVNHGLFQSGSAPAAGEWGGEGIDYRVLTSKRPTEAGFQEFWHEEAQVPWLYDPRTGIWISYDDPRSIRKKAAYVREERFGGIMFWELSGDDGTLLDAIHSGLRPGH
jgi:chitinase